MKICSLCKKEKDLEEFYIDRRSPSGKASRCKECSKKESKRWYQISDKYKQIIRNSGLKHRFGIDSEDYFNMLEEQNGVCAICRQKPEGKYLHVDHNHETGEIRGLLCKTCNHGLGNFKDNKTYLKNAIEYLDRKSIRE